MSYFLIDAFFGLYALVPTSVEFTDGSRVTRAIPTGFFTPMKYSSVYAQPIFMTRDDYTKFVLENLDNKKARITVKENIFTLASFHPRQMKPGHDTREEHLRLLNPAHVKGINEEDYSVLFWTDEEDNIYLECLTTGG